MTLRFSDTRDFRNICERAVTVIAVQQIAIKRQPSRPAIDRNSAIPTVRVSRAAGSRRNQTSSSWQRPDRVAVKVSVKKGTAGVVTDAVLQQAGLCGHVFKALAPNIAIQNVLPPIRNEEINEAIPVIVSSTNALPPARLLQAGR